MLAAVPELLRTRLEPEQEKEAEALIPIATELRIPSDDDALRVRRGCACVVGRPCWCALPAAL
jgi:hypothetical protein